MAKTLRKLENCPNCEQPLTGDNNYCTKCGQENTTKSVSLGLLIRDVLDVWIRERGGRWEEIEGRPGERVDEFLVGELELPYTRTLTLGGGEHYLISFNEKCPEGLEDVVSSANAERLTDEEIVALIDSVPAEED